MKHVKNKSRIKDKETKDIYSGEASPYREWLDDKGDYNQDHEALEPKEANPDILGESEGLYYLRTDLNEEQMEQFKKALPLLSDKQKLVLQMVGYEGKTLENTAAILGISKGNVADLLNRARKIIIGKNKNF